MKLFVCCENCKSLYAINQWLPEHQCPACDWVTDMQDYEFPELEIPEKYWN